MTAIHRPTENTIPRPSVCRCSECGRLLLPSASTSAAVEPRALCDACYQWAVCPNLAGTEKLAFNPHAY
jgi:hypothetical protein